MVGAQERLGSKCLHNAACTKKVLGNSHPQKQSPEVVNYIYCGIDLCFLKHAVRVVYHKFKKFPSSHSGEVQQIILHSVVERN